MAGFDNGMKQAAQAAHPLVMEQHAEPAFSTALYALLNIVLHLLHRASRWHRSRFSSFLV
jgi:hypothetical protein